MVSTLEQLQVPNWTGPGVRRSKRPLLASRTRYRYAVYLESESYAKAQVNMENNDRKKIRLNNFYNRVKTLAKGGQKRLKKIQLEILQATSNNAILLHLYNHMLFLTFIRMMNFVCGHRSVIVTRHRTICLVIWNISSQYLKWWQEVLRKTSFFISNIKRNFY